MTGKTMVGAVLATAAVGVAAVAVASADDVYKATATASSGGSTAKPLPVAAKFSYTGAGDDGARTGTAKTIAFRWDGVRENGAAFPKCTSTQIDAAQSDSVCPKGSIVATGTVMAKLGPENDLKSNVDCTKGLKVYNAGAGKSVLFVTGDPAKCAGVGYLPPLAMTWKVKSGGSELSLPFPTNISHPLPGLAGAFSSFGLSFPKQSAKVKGKTVGYLQSVGCKGTRGFTLTVTPESGATAIAKTKAGKC